MVSSFRPLLTFAVDTLSLMAILVLYDSFSAFPGKRYFYWLLTDQQDTFNHRHDYLRLHSEPLFRMMKVVSSRVKLVLQQTVFFTLLKTISSCRYDVS